MSSPCISFEKGFSDISQVLSPGDLNYPTVGTDELHDLIRKQAEEIRQQAEKMSAQMHAQAEENHALKRRLEETERRSGDLPEIDTMDLAPASAALSDYYERLYIVNYAGVNMSPERDSRDLLKLGMEDVEMDANTLKDLDITCTIALSLVREARRDVTAVHMTILPGNRLNFLVSKNDISSSDTDAYEKDSILCHALIKVFLVPEEYMAKHAFSARYLDVLLQHCRPKLQLRLENAGGDNDDHCNLQRLVNVLETLSRKKIRTICQSVRANEPSNEPKSEADLIVDHFMITFNDDYVAAVLRVASLFLQRYKSNSSLSSGQVFYEASMFSYTLASS